MDQDKIINLELSLSEVNEVLTILGKGKYSRVAVLIAKIQSQTLKQVNVPMPEENTK
jgi:hypothetical protein